eukprot:CAMPEP_0116868124 /NCGR_PEP_ID=MMETSP0418-20121206/27008_1 /TAXON_ID=1158023 /ORGANISM="Astrosyne radiata, Strain 13vi08-1A" /LENGTH=73 /DNA_ID=CAMNT_0004504031 /DNA_START=151 /DNA_END=372 /DNA_ORIENTATION=+
MRPFLWGAEEIGLRYLPNQQGLGEVCGKLICPIQFGIRLEVRLLSQPCLVPAFSKSASSKGNPRHSDGVDKEE